MIFQRLGNLIKIKMIFLKDTPDLARIEQKKKILNENHSQEVVAFSAFLWKPRKINFIQSHLSLNLNYEVEKFYFVEILREK